MFKVFENKLILVRGDCCCRRGISMNYDRYGKPRKMIVNEKAPNFIFADHIKGLTVPQKELIDVSDVDRMGKSLKFYYENQNLKSILDVGDADFIFMDSYSDMNFSMYRHRLEGWKLWVHLGFLRNKERFELDYEYIGYRSFEEAVDDNLKVIEKLQISNPNALFFYFSQPIAYYEKMEKRKEFLYLGRELEERVENLFWGGVEHELEPADMDSCGPGQTLHFTANTYAKMIDICIKKSKINTSDIGKAQGAEGYLNKNQPKGDGGSNFVPLLSESSLLDFKDKLFIPEVCEDRLAVLRFIKQTVECNEGCINQIQAARKSLDSYLVFEGEELSKIPRFTPMLIDTSSYKDYDDFESYVKSMGKGARIRNKKRSIKNGYYCKLFPWKQFIPDVYEINTSKMERSGGVMKSSYNRTIEELGGAPEKTVSMPWPKCSYHWQLTWGTFMPINGYMQGDVITNEKLLAYINLRRWGDFILYSQILGHGDYLNEGVLIHLHLEIVNWVMTSDMPYLKGLRYVMYGGLQNGGSSLSDWKLRCGFKPYHVVADQSSSLPSTNLDSLNFPYDR